jgi:hypothetical protein
MPNLSGTLDVVLGFITVVLVLSLIIQSVQNIVKRLLAMKSKQAEQSLRMLFDYALSDERTKFTQMKYASPVVASLGKMLGRGEDDGDGEREDKGKSKSKDTSGDTDRIGALVEEVKQQVLEMGRKSFWGNAILDSITKDDLDKILKNVEANAFDENAKAAIKGKVEEVQKWYDTVMPGLTERYERGMKWMAVLLSAIVVVLLNADAIKVYKFVAADPVVQQQLLDYGSTLISERKEAAKNKPENQANPDKSVKPGAANPNPPRSSPTANSNTSGESASQNSNTAAASDAGGISNTAANSNSGVTAATTANSNSPTNSNSAGTVTGAKPGAGAATDQATGADQNADEEQLKQIQEDINKVKGLYSDYRKLGLKPFNWEGSFTNYHTAWHTVLGWLVMTLLLSLGAPFWEDALESIFGLKNTLRSKAKTEEKKAQQG